MHWIPIAAWIAALVVAAVVLGFCAYEIIWKARRLRGDVATLQQVNAQLADLQGALSVTQQRLAAARRPQPTPARHALTSGPGLVTR